MIIKIPKQLLDQIHSHGEATYPDEGAGFILGEAVDSTKQVLAVRAVTNAREDSARHNRFLITPQDMMFGEDEASRLGLEVIGVFHSHPDHPNRPSEYDREWALPWYSYLITTVNTGTAVASRSWQLSEARDVFVEEEIQVIE